MAAPPLVRSLVRALVRQYCRRIPVQQGKIKLMFHCHHLVTPYIEEAPLDFGGKFRVDLTDNIQRQIYFLGHYEPKITELIRRTLAPGDTFIDIGANTGYYTVLAGLLVGSQGVVHSFEPIPYIFSAMQSNVSLNSLNNVYLNQVALYEDETEVEMFLPGAGNLGCGSMVKQPHHPGLSIRCPATSLDRYVKRVGIEHIRLIKMDIEGGEFSALKGMKEVLSNPSGPDLICEAIPDLLTGAGHTTADLVQLLESFGYHAHKIDGWNLHFTR